MGAFLEMERDLIKKRASTAGPLPPTTSRSVPPLKMEPIPPLVKPIEPTDEECCGLDCPNCVFIVYQEKLLDYDASLAATVPSIPNASCPSILSRGEERDTPSRPTLTFTTTLLDNDPTLVLEDHMEHLASVLSVHPLTVVTNRELCPNADPTLKRRSTRHLELTRYPSTSSSSAHTSLSYGVADHVALCIPNPVALVHRCCTLVGVAPTQRFQLTARASSSLDVTSTEKKIAVPFYDAVTLYEALRWCCDLTATPRRAIVSQLASFATDVSEKNALLALSQQDRAYRDTLWTPQRSLVDLLEMFPSVCDTLCLGMLFQLLPPTHRRYYTIVSSPTPSPDRIALAIRVLEEPSSPSSSSSSNPSLPASGPLVYRGIGSTYLAHLRPQESIVLGTITPSALVFPNVTYHDTTPSSLSLPPVLMVGPGTGLAPFRSFLHELDAATAGKPFLTTLLFTGCKHPAADALYADELADLVARHTLTHCFTSYSKVAPERREYVQHRLVQEGPLVYDTLIRQGGSFYVCGSVAMGNMVQRALEEILVTQGHGVTPLDAAATLVTLKQQGRYQMELWG